MKTKEQNTMNENAKKLAFVPQRIGIPNIKRQNEIIRAYEKLLSAACDLQMAVEHTLRLDADNSNSFSLFLELIKNDTKNYLTGKYVEMNNISIPGISTEKLIESNLVDIQNIDNALQSRKEFDKAWEYVKSLNFRFSLESLYVNGYWELTEEFFKKVEQTCSRYTVNEQQNSVLAVFNDLCSVLNRLNDLNIVQAAKGQNDVLSIFDCIEIDRTNPEAPFVVDDVLFWRHRLQRFKAKI